MLHIVSRCPQVQAGGWPAAASLGSAEDVAVRWLTAYYTTLTVWDHWVQNTHSWWLLCIHQREVWLLFADSRRECSNSNSSSRRQICKARLHTKVPVSQTRLLPYIRALKTASSLGYV